ncbi:MAG: DNA internalization-related competence protein ComEC/Rec2 [Labilithrix sp.]|nr:DNA internalization-related competence protein ComEC/Rec2 [Labilithrix sp.]
MQNVDLVLLVGCALCSGALAGVAPIAAGVATAIVLVVIARRGRRAVALLGALAFLLGSFRGAATIASHERARARVVSREPWPARVVVTGVVSRSPVLAGDAYRFDVSSDDGTVVTLHAPREAGAIARGDRVEAIAQVAPLHQFWNEGTGDPRPAQARRGVVLSGGADDVVIRARGRGVAAIVDRLRDRLRRRIVATFPAESAAMARALVLGEDDLTASDQRAFRRSGLAHLLAVSGMHLVIVVAGTVAALRAILVRVTFLATRVDVFRVAAGLGLPFAWLYADLAGGSGSAIRAAWMTSAALLARVLARRPDTWRAFGLSICGAALVDPLAAFDMSFALSACATFGMIAFARPIAVRLEGAAPSRNPLVRAIASSAAASIACAPLLACMTADLPLAGLFANLIAVPLGELAALPLCLAHALLEPLPAAERGCAWAASGALMLVRKIAHLFAAMPYGAAHVPTPTAWQLAAMAVGAFGLTCATAKRRIVWIGSAAILVLALELEARARGAPTGVLRVTFLDVGQGDAALIDLPDGRAVLVDGGGLVGSPVDIGERVIAPVLRARRRSAIAAVVLSHPHPDHFGGLRTGLGRVRVGALWDTGQGENEGAGGAYADLLAEMRSRGVHVVRPDALCGRRLSAAGATLEVLAPCPSASIDHGPNDNSFVLRVAFGERAFLFVGDAERAEEAELLEKRRAALRADVLKVGHHGSRTSSTPPFLAAVSPSIAVISSGVRNRFGHPAPATLRNLGAARARILRTDREGSITITTDGRSLEVTTTAE